MPDMPIERLRSLVAVSAFSGVTAAGEALHITRSAVSSHVKKLERDLGCDLLRPQGRGVTLTADGEVLVAKARQLLEMHDDTVEELAPPDENSLVVAATEHAAESLVPRLIRSLRAFFPQRRIKLRLTRSAKARELFHDERADVVLALHSPETAALHVADLPLEWVGTPGGPVDRIIAFERPCAVRDIAMVAATGGDAHIVKECPDLSSVLAAVAAGEGVSPLPRSGPRGRPFSIVTALPALSPVPLYLAASQRVSSPILRSVLDDLRGQLSGLPEEVSDTVAARQHRTRHH